MIDTDKYKGHLMDGDFQVWRWSSKMIKVANYEEQMATAELLRDTPLLLAEVKRLQKRNEWLEEVVALAQGHELLDLGNSNEWPQWEESE